jgi:putative transposase
VHSNNNVVYRCTYQVVWCPKRRRKVITGAVDERLKEIIREVPHPTLWTNSYFVATVGGATLEVVNRYVENHRNV